MDTAPGSLSLWVPSTVRSSSSSPSPFSLPCGSMEDLPFSLEELPPEIRNKIDDIIDKNEDLESQMDAIDALLFAGQPPAKFDAGVKSDLGNESGIGSDSDSGHGFIPAPDQSVSSSTSIAPFTYTGTVEEMVSNAKMFTRSFRPPPPPAPVCEVDDFISRLMVLPPPPPPQGLHGSAAPDMDHLGASGAYRPTSASPSIRNSPRTKCWKIDEDDVIGLPPPPPGFGGSVSEDLEVFHPPSNDLSSEHVMAVRSGNDIKVTLNVPRGPWMNPDQSPTGISHGNVSRVLVAGYDDPVPVKMAPVPVMRSVARPLAQSDSVPAIHKSSTLPGISLSQRPKSGGTELYAWDDMSALPHSGSAVSVPEITITEKRKPLLGSGVVGKVQRPTELTLSSPRKAPMGRKGEVLESDAVSISSNVSTPTRYSKMPTGSTVDLRRKKWRPMSEIHPGGSTDVEEKKAKSRPISVSGLSEDEGRVLSSMKNQKQGPGSDDDISGLVQMRVKNKKPVQNTKIDHRTRKANSMLSLYDPSSDFPEKSKDKKSSRKRQKAETTQNKTRFSALFQKKLKVHKTNSENKDRAPIDNKNGVVALRVGETEVQRSDYLLPAATFTSTRSSIPSPSLYSGMNSNSSGIGVRSSPPAPGDISDILRIDVRDLQVEDRRPRLSFETFLGELKPIRWIEEETKFSVSNRWSHSGVGERQSPAEHRSFLGLASRYSLPGNFSQPGNSNGKSLQTQITNSLHPNSQETKRPFLTSKTPPASPRQRQPMVDPVTSNTPRILLVNGQSTTAPVIKVTTPTGVGITAAQAPTIKVTTPTVTAAQTPTIKVTTPTVTAAQAPTIKVTTPPVLGPTSTQPPTVKIKTTPSPLIGKLSTPTLPLRHSVASEQMGNILTNDDVRGRKTSLERNNSFSPTSKSPERDYCFAPISKPPRQNLQHVNPEYVSLRGSLLDVPGTLEETTPVRISPTPSIRSLQNVFLKNPGNFGNAGVQVDPGSHNVLETTYSDMEACERAVDDTRRMLSNLVAESESLLSSSASSSISWTSSVSFNSNKDALAVHSRQLVTDAKLMVAGATRSRHELVTSLTAVIHTVARVFESCRLVLASMPPGSRRLTLLDDVIGVGRVFLDTLTAANLAAGKERQDPTMEKLMSHTTDLALALGKLVTTIKRLDSNT